MPDQKTENSTNLLRVDVNGSSLNSILKNLPIKIEQLICSTFGQLILSSEGTVYSLSYIDLEPVSSIFNLTESIPVFLMEISDFKSYL